MRNLSATAPVGVGVGVLSHLALEQAGGETNALNEKKPQPSKVDAFNNINGLPDRRTEQENNNLKSIVFQQENDVASSVLASGIFNLINRKPRIVRLHLCAGCNSHKSLKKFSAIPNICRACVESAKAMPPRARVRFIEGAKENLHKKLSSMLGGLI